MASPLHSQDGNTFTIVEKVSVPTTNYIGYFLY